MLACCLLHFAVHFGGVVNICNESLTFCNHCHHSVDRIVVCWISCISNAILDAPL